MNQSQQSFHDIVISLDNLRGYVAYRFEDNLIPASDNESHGKVFLSLASITHY